MLVGDSLPLQRTREVQFCIEGQDELSLLSDVSRKNRKIGRISPEEGAITVEKDEERNSRESKSRILQDFVPIET